MSTAARSTFITGLALAIIGSVLFSAKAIVVKLAYRYGVDAATLIALRMAVSGPLFVLAYAWSSRNAAPLAARDHLRLIVLGLLGYYAASMLDFMGLQFITAALERLILYLNPTLVLLMSALFLGKRFGQRELAALALAYCGIVLVFMHDVSLEGDGVALGSVLVFGSAVCYAAYLVISGEAVRRIGAIRLTSYAMCVSTLAVFAQFVFLNPLESLRQPSPVYGLSLINGTLCTVLPVFATMLAVERIGAGRTAVAAMIGPVSTIALAFFFLGERVGAWQLAGTTLVLVGIYVLSRSTRPASEPAVNKENA